MTTHGWMTLAILGLVLALFLWNRLRVDVVALIGLALLLAFGIVSPAEAVAGFSNEATITVALMLILSAGLVRTGAIDDLARRAAQLVQGSEVRLLLLVLCVVVPVSAFINNTAAVAVLLPVVLGLASEVKVPPSRLLMPLSFGAQLGGTLTLIGTSTNLVVAGIVVELGLERIGMFDITPPALFVVGAGVLYILTVGRWLTPRREAGRDLLELYDLHEYVTALDVLPGSPLVGKSLGESRFNERYNLQVIRIERAAGPVVEPRSRTVIHANDVLLVQGRVAGITDIEEGAGLTISGASQTFRIETEEGANQLAEVLVPPRSQLVGRSLREVRFRARYGMSVLGVRRHGEAIHEAIGSIRFQPGDILLVQGSTATLRNLHDEGDVSLIGVVPMRRRRRRRAGYAVAILLGVVLLASLGITSIVTAALFGVLALFLTGCIEPARAYEELDGKVLVLLAAMIPLGFALQETGAAAAIAAVLLGVVAPLGPLGALAGFYVLTSFTTEVISNAATAVVLTPIAVSLANSLGVSPMPFVIAVMFAASNSFSTPIGYQTNLFIFGPGGYEFRDYLRVGGPLSLLIAIVATLVIPVFFPF